MSIVLSAFGVALAAFCVWLIVRIVNRRERWAKWTLGLVIGLPVLYVASFGPACWLTDWGLITGNSAGSIYRPLLAIAVLTRSDQISNAALWYGKLASPEYMDARWMKAVHLIAAARDDWDTRKRKRAPRYSRNSMR